MNVHWKAAVEGLTPQGSEYVDDPEACAAAIRERCRYPKQIIEARARVEQLEKALREIIGEQLSGETNLEFVPDDAPVHSFCVNFGMLRRARATLKGEPG